MSTKRIRRNPAVASRVIDAEAIVMTPQDGMLHAFNAVGTRIWQLCEKTTSVSEVAGCICREFDVGPARARRDVQVFIRELMGKGMLISVSG